MERLGEGCVLMLLYVSLLWCFDASAATAGSISVDVLNSDGSTGRRLLQQPRECKADFESANYSIVTTKCKKPEYPRDICCSAFKELICPYRNYINDLNSNCADVMFSYLNAKGNYPAALFSSMCLGDKNGLECPELTPLGNQASGFFVMRPSSAAIVLVGSLLTSTLFLM